MDTESKSFFNVEPKDNRIILDATKTNGVSEASCVQYVLTKKEAIKLIKKLAESLEYSR